MNCAQIGTTVSVLGYVLAISGGCILFMNTAPDVPAGQIPTYDGGDHPVEAFNAHTDRQNAGVKSRRRANRLGFALLTGGSSFQLVGTLISGFSN